MEKKQNASYFFTVVNSQTGKGRSDLGTGISYCEKSGVFTTLVDDKNLSFKPMNEIYEDEKQINFYIDDGSKVTFRFVDVALYESLKGYMLNYNAPVLNNDEEVQRYLTKEMNMSY